MSRLHEYNPEFGVVFETELEKWIREHGGGEPTKPDQPTGGGTTTKPTGTAPTGTAPAKQYGLPLPQGANPTGDPNIFMVPIPGGGNMIYTKNETGLYNASPSGAKVGAASAVGSSAGGAGTKPSTTFTPFPKAPPVDYAAKGAADKTAQQQSTGNYYPADAILSKGGVVLGRGLDGQPTRIAMPGTGKEVYQLDPATGLYGLSGFPLSAADARTVASSAAGPTGRAGTGIAPAAPPQGLPPVTSTTAQPSTATTPQQPVAGLPVTQFTTGQNRQALSLPPGYQHGASGFTGVQGSDGTANPNAFKPYDFSFSSADTPGSPATNVLMDNPQIAHLGNMSQGFNPQMYLDGPGQPHSTGDSATDATLAAQIIQKQQGQSGGSVMPQNYGQSAFYQGDKSGPLEWVTRSDSGYSFEPGKVNGGNSLRSPMAGSDTPVMTPQGTVIRSSTDASPAQQAYNAQAAGLAPVQPTSNVGAVYQQSYNSAANPQYASAANLPSQADALALAAAQAEKDKEAALGGADGPVRGFATGGTVSVDPYKVASTPPATSPSPIPNPGMLTGPVQNPQQQTPRMPQVPGTGSPLLDTTGSTTTPNFDPTDPHLLDPFQEAANQLAQQQHMRQNTNYINQRAGLGAAQGIAVQPGQHPTAPLGANQFYDYAPAVQDSMNQISGLQRDITGYGGLVDASALRAQQNSLNNDQNRYQTAQGYMRDILGYGPAVDTGSLEGRKSALDQQLAPLLAIQGYQQELAALGNQRNPADIASDQASVEGSIKMIQDSIAAAQAGGPPSQFSGTEIPALQARLAALGTEATDAGNASRDRDRLTTLLGNNTLPVDDQIGTLRGQKTDLQTQIDNANSSAKSRDATQRLLDGLIQPGEDVNAALARVQGQLAPLGQKIGNADKAQGASDTLQNLIGKGVPGFAGGGQVSVSSNAPVSQRDLAFALSNFGKKEAGPAESQFSSIAQQQWNPNDNLRMRNFADGGMVSANDPYAAASGSSMTTPEPITGVGQQTGKPYFQVGEAGPENISITPSGQPGGPPPSAFRQMAGTGDADVASMLARVQMQAQTGVSPHPAILQHISTLIPQMKDANAQNQAANILAGITASLPRQQPGPVGAPLFQDPLAMFGAAKFGNPKAPVAA